jgi:hypothetical protein
MSAYVDTSALLRLVLREPLTHVDWKLVLQKHARLATAPCGFPLSNQIRSDNASLTKTLTVTAVARNFSAVMDESGTRSRRDHPGAQT